MKTRNGSAATDLPWREPRTAITCKILLVSVFVLLAGCTTNPNTGRSQLMAFPAVQTAQADIGYALAATAQGLAPSSTCARTNRSAPIAGEAVSACPNAVETAKFARQVERIGAELEVQARALAPDLFERVKAFQIEVKANLGTGTGSSAGGRIALASELAALDPTDDIVAFLIAREMGHVIARHQEEDSGARMAFSALTALVPGSLIIKIAASILGTQAMTTTWAKQQLREADELALALLNRTHRSPDAIALNLRIGLKREYLPAGDWGKQFTQSIERVASIAGARPDGLMLAGSKDSAPGRPTVVLALAQK